MVTGAALVFLTSLAASVPPMTAPLDASLLTEAWRRARDHQPFFCEENVLRLLTSGALPEPSAAVFVTNAQRCVPMWGQRAAISDPIEWDYHVTALLPQHGLVVDLDDRTQVARPIKAWLEHAFRRDTPPQRQPRFRIVPRADLLATFSSDRSHMRNDQGQPLRPFPSWPAPLQPQLGHTLMRFLDLDDDIAGVVTEAAGLAAFRCR